MKTLVRTKMLVLAVSMIGVNYANAQTTLTAERIRHTVMPGSATAIHIQTMANAVCALHPEDANAGEQSLKVFADDEGVVRFQVRPASASDKTARFVAECEVNGKVMAHHIELRAASDPSPGFPAVPTFQPNPARPKGVVRPALEGDPMLLSDSELLQRGYPYRPDPKKAPEAYAGWLAAVSRPSIGIAAKLVARPDRFHGPARIIPQNNWCGFALAGGSYPFNWVMGEWVVPTVFPEPAQGFLGNTATYSSLWIGLDGDGSGDVVQDGTEQETHLYFGGAWTVQSDYAWYEWYPTAEQAIANFPVKANDFIFSEVAVVNANGLRDANGNTGWFYLDNLTNGQFTVITTPMPGNTAFFGSSADWIMERPTVNGMLPDLSRFLPALMWSAAATRQNGDYPLVFQESYDQFNMVDNVGKPMCTPQQTGPSSMQFLWSNYN
jgi:Peptidase A4 family